VCLWESGREVRQMKGSTKDRVEGKFHEVKGKIKEIVGEAVNSPKLAIEGRIEKFAGITQEQFGKVKKTVGR
jgi:uncharacterized protein YjbJ (UPF0337 family)